MNTQSLNRLVAKETGLKKSEKVADFVRDSGSGNIAYRLVKVYRFRNGDFHCVKEYENTYTVLFDRFLNDKEIEKIIEALNANGCKTRLNNRSIWVEA